MGFSFFSDLINPTSYDVPDAPQVDVADEQLKAQKANYASFGEAKKLATDFNAFMRSELKAAVPEFSALQEQMAKNLAAQLKGEIPGDVASSVARSSAAKGLRLGVAGSPAGEALTARDLGLTSLDIQSRAQAQTPAYLGAMASLVGPKYDFAHTFLSPAQRIAFQFQNADNKWNVENLKNQMDAQPEPWMKALAGLGDSVVNYAASYYTMGGGFGGGGSAPSAPAWNTPYFNSADADALRRYGLS